MGFKMLQLRKKKPILVTIHGFGSRLHHEMDPLAYYLKKKHYSVRQFDIYDLKNPEDANFQEWIERCEYQVREALKQSDNVVILGFSMGGVIASYLASIYPIKQLILVAPAFRYFDFTLLKTKTAEIISKSPKEKKLKPSNLQTKCFMDIVDKFRSSIEHVTCPVLMIHGTADEIIDFESSKEAYRKIQHNKKRLVFLEGAHHRLLYDNQMQEVAFVLIEQMLKNNLIK